MSERDELMAQFMARSGNRFRRLPQPGSAAFLATIQPPEPSGELPSSLPAAPSSVAAAPAGNPTPAGARVVLSWGRGGDTVVVGIERAPTWDLAETWRVPEAAVLALLPVLQTLAPVKDLTGELVRPTPQRITFPWIEGGFPAEVKTPLGWQGGNWSLPDRDETLDGKVGYREDLEPLDDESGQPAAE